MKFSQGSVLEWTRVEYGQDVVERYDITGDDRANSAAVGILRKLMNEGSFANPFPESFVPEPGTVSIEMIDHMQREYDFKLFRHEQNNIIFGNLSKIIAGEEVHHAQFNRHLYYPDADDKIWAELVEILTSGKGSYLNDDGVHVMIRSTPRFTLDRLGNLFVGNAFRILPMNVIESEY